MAAIPEAINIAVDVAATTLYTAFVGAASKAELVSLDLANTTSAEITVDVYVESAGPVDRYLGKAIPVPANGSASWRGMVTLDTAGQLIVAIASAVGVDALGTVIEDV